MEFNFDRNHEQEGEEDEEKDRILILMRDLFFRRASIRMTENLRDSIEVILTAEKTKLSRANKQSSRANKQQLTQEFIHRQNGKPAKPAKPFPYPNPAMIHPSSFSSAHPLTRVDALESLSTQFPLDTLLSDPEMELPRSDCFGPSTPALIDPLALQLEPVSPPRLLARPSRLPNENSRDLDSVGSSKCASPSATDYFPESPPSSICSSSSFSSSSFLYSSSPASPSASRSSCSSEDFVNEILMNTVFHPINLQFPVSRRFESSFLDFVASLFPDPTDHLRKSFLALKCELDASDLSGHSYKTYFLGKEKSISLLESEANVDEEHGTTGLWTTSASIILSDWLQHHSKFTDGLNVLELGCGCGYVGISLMAAATDRETPAGPAKYTYTDLLPKVLSQCEENVALNAMNLGDGKFEYRICDWFKFMREDWAFPMDVVLGADIVYITEVIPSLVNVIKSFLTNSLLRKKCHKSSREIDIKNDEECPSQLITDPDHDYLADNEAVVNSVDASPPKGAVAFLVFTIRQAYSMDFFILCARNSGLEVIDLEDIEDPDWEFPDRDFFSSSERDANFKMIRISNCLSDEESEIVFADC